MIERKTAEAARRRVIEIDRYDREVYRAEFLATLDAERAECVKLWNEFCAEETKRLAAPKAPTYAEVLPGIWVPSARSEYRTAVRLGLPQDVRFALAEDARAEEEGEL